MLAAVVILWFLGAAKEFIEQLMVDYDGYDYGLRLRLRLFYIFFWPIHATLMVVDFLYGILQGTL